MLAYSLEITKRGNEGITNRGNLRDFKSEQKDYKLGQRLQIGAREITNRGSDFKSRQEYKSVQNSVSLS